MAKFYAGQPVRCVWSKEKWLENNDAAYAASLESRGLVPTLGRTYRVGGYATDTYVWGQEMNSGMRYREDGFEPATDIQVLRELLETAPKWRERQREDAL